MGKSYRSFRLGEEIRRIISNLLLFELKDPRLSGIVSVSSVNVTQDNSFATVYISVLCEEEEEAAAKARKEEVMEAFRGAKGLIRKEIAKQIKLRHAPDLAFMMDTSMEYGMHISKVIADLGIGTEKEDEEE
jgi:ribosome-binding factor A